MHYLENKTNPKISQWLWETYKIKITSEALRQHFQNHPRVPDEVKKQYKARQAGTKKVAGKIVDEIATLDQLILDELEAHGLVKAWITQIFAMLNPSKDEYGVAKLPYIPMALITMNQGTIAELRQLIKTKYELLDGDLSGQGAASVATAVKKAYEHRVQRLGGTGGGDPK